MLFYKNSAANNERFDAENLKNLGGGAAAAFHTKVRNSIDEISYQHSRISFLRDPCGSLALVITDEHTVKVAVKTDEHGKLLIVFHVEPSEKEWGVSEVYEAMQEHFPPILGIIALLESKILNGASKVQSDYLSDMVTLLRQDYHEKYNN